MSDQPRPDAAQVPPPALVAAWFRIGLLSTDRLPMWAAHWLVGGADGPALAELAGLRSSDAGEAHDLLPGALAECGLPLPPSRAHAASTVLSDLADQVLTGRADPARVMAEVGRVLLATEDVPEVRALPLAAAWRRIDEAWTHDRALSAGQRDDLVSAAAADQQAVPAGPDRPGSTTLWRPVGPQELALLEASGWTAWPPRLPDQPIFYPVLTREYAVQIARDWNVPQSGAGYVTEFDVRTDFVDRYDVHQVGGHAIVEYWIPAADLQQLNDSIVGRIRVVDRFEDEGAKP